MCGAPVRNPVAMRYDEFMDSATAAAAAMCGGPLLSPVTMGYAHMDMAAAAEAMDMGSPPAPSSSPGTSPQPGDSDTLSFFFTGPPPRPPPLPWQQLLAKAERGKPKTARQQAAESPAPSWQRLLAKAERGMPKTARQQAAESPAPPSWQRLLAEAERGLPTTAAARLVAMAERGLPPSWQVAARPNRKGSKAAKAKCGAPLPPPMQMPIVVLEPPADVVDVGSSAPATPPSDSDGSWETTPSPRGPLPALSPDSESDALPWLNLLPGGAACGLATAWQAPPQLPFAPPPRVEVEVEVRQVWAHNLEQESRLIESLLPKFPYMAVDTEFPGTVHRPAGPVHGLTAEERYDLLRRNVDDLHLIQIGLTLFDSGGRLPGLGGAAAPATRYVWEFSLREFDVRRHLHAPESIAMLRDKGVDFGRTRERGVDAAALGPRLRKWLRAGLGRAGVVTFSGGYDMAYLVKMAFGDGYKMPKKAEEFEGVAKALLRRRRLFDVKEMAGHCPGDLRGGLSTVAAKLGVERAVGEAHKAGSDSLLTCHVFMKMKECFFGDDNELTRLAGAVNGMTA
ncbi:hypothetical protein U9M48_011840 [Paspalum notatum var. saurae]|uniref:poly(A)-specific ribonuclease n=1 Tax=Paspalum notatum var. saurae TaxID=547442 RepID=A0AAQ3WHS1_PASNO